MLHRLNFIKGTNEMVVHLIAWDKELQVNYSW